MMLYNITAFYRFLGVPDTINEHKKTRVNL